MQPFCVNDILKQDVSLNFGVIYRVNPEVRGKKVEELCGRHRVGCEINILHLHDRLQTASRSFSEVPLANSYVGLGRVLSKP